MKNLKYSLVHSRQYKKDYRRISQSGRYDLKKIDAVLTILREGKKLPAHLRNHHLKGDIQHWEECHIEADWLLIYERKEDTLVLIAQRTGTHSELFE